MGAHQWSSLFEAHVEEGVSWVVDFDEIVDTEFWSWTIIDDIKKSRAIYWCNLGDNIAGPN